MEANQHFHDTLPTRGNGCLCGQNTQGVTPQNDHNPVTIPFTYQVHNSGESSLYLVIDFIYVD